MKCTSVYNTFFNSGEGMVWLYISDFRNLPLAETCQHSMLFLFYCTCDTQFLDVISQSTTLLTISGTWLMLTYCNPQYVVHLYQCHYCHGKIVWQNENGKIPLDGRVMNARAVQQTRPEYMLYELEFFCKTIGRNA